MCVDRESMHPLPHHAQLHTGLGDAALGTDRWTFEKLTGRDLVYTKHWMDEFVNVTITA